MNNAASGGPRLGDATPEEAPAKLEATQKGGANWFYWIAGLSLVNTVLVMTDSGVSFIIGLGITQVVDAVMHQVGGQALIFVGLFVNLAIAVFFVLMGTRASQGRRWAFLAGMVLYALDGGIFLLIGDYLSLGFHVFALFFIFNGYRANEMLAALAAARAESPAATES